MEMSFIKTARGLLRRGVGPDRIDQFRENRRQSREIRNDPVLREHARRLARFRNRYAGQRCVILGNGPSLAKMDLSVLRDEYTFGLNRVYLLFDKLGFETTFLVSVNDLVIQQCASELIGTGCTKFFSARHRELLDTTRPDVVLVRESHRRGFCKRPAAQGVWEGATVTYVAMQLAYFMGFTTVILAGVDHRFAAKGPAHQVVESKGADSDHFDPRYFGAGFKWQLPDLEMSEDSYRMALETFTRAGRTIVDGTVDGALTIFPKVNFHNFLLSSPR